MPVLGNWPVQSGAVGNFESLHDDDSALPLEASGLACAWQDGQPIAPRRSWGRRVQLALKRASDIVIAGLALVALSPILLAVALIIKLTDNGPILFRQSRIGFGGKPFEILKFRSMRVDGCDHSGTNQTKLGDDRLTRVGRVLRRTSIDELPQLLNIVIGDMSLVGPRPHVQGQLAAHRPYHELVPYYDSRYLMRPGLTGWAQCNGFRGPTDDARLAQARIEHDIAYIQNFSLLLDVRIVLRTLVHEFLTGSGL